MSLARVFTLSIALSGTLASPLEARIERIKQLLGRDTFEWTALGDSYSSGVGAGEYTSNSYRCLRFDHAYPVLMNNDDRLPNKDHKDTTMKFNNVVCSGSNTTEVEAYQFYDKPTSGKPNAQYGRLNPGVESSITLPNHCTPWYDYGTSASFQCFKMFERLWILLL